MRNLRLPALLICAAAALGAGAPAPTPAPAPVPTSAHGKAGWPPSQAKRVMTAQAVPQPHAPKPAPAQAAWSDLLQGNRRFVRGVLTARDVVKRRAELLETQHPVAAVLGCADSRVPPELLFDRGLGDLFVVRTAGNVADKVALGSLEYAVEHLGVSLVVVLGHERCGAVATAAAVAAAGQAPESPNLAEIVARIAPGLDRLGGVVEGPGLVRLGVDVNVHRSAHALLAESEILRRAVEEKRLTIEKAVYRLETGEVVPLD